MSEQDDPMVTFGGIMVILVVVGLLGYCSLAQDCDAKGGTLLKDAMGFPQCVAVRKLP